MRLWWMAPFKPLNRLSGCYFQGQQLGHNLLPMLTPRLMQKERHISTALDSLDRSVAHKCNAELTKQLRTFAQERPTFSTISHTSCHKQQCANLSRSPSCCNASFEHIHGRRCWPLRPHAPTSNPHSGPSHFVGHLDASPAWIPTPPQASKPPCCRYNFRTARKDSALGTSNSRVEPGT